MFEFLFNVLWAAIEGLFCLLGRSKEKKSFNGCKPCYDLKGINDINDGKHLTQVIRKLRKQIVFSSFKETTLKVSNTEGGFLKLPIKAPWPDYIEYSFKCNECQAKYNLSAETLDTGINYSIKGVLKKH